MDFQIPAFWILIGLLIIALIILLAILRKLARPASDCQPFSQIVVSGFAPGLQIENVECTSDRAFLVYCSTNFQPNQGYGVNVKSTGSGGGTGAPIYIVGAPANDVITFTFSPGITGFLTLQTECGAKASISR